MPNAKASLKIVRQPINKPEPYNDDRGKRRMTAIRDQLMAAAIRYVEEGKDGCRSERLRTASNLSGIPLVLIESSARK